MRQFQLKLVVRTENVPLIKGEEYKIFLLLSICGFANLINQSIKQINCFNRIYFVFKNFRQLRKFCWNYSFTDTVTNDNSSQVCQV